MGTNGAYYNLQSYYWNSSANNTWSESNLNTVNLNQNYLNNVGSKWSSLIATHAWKVGGITSDQRDTPPKSVYNYEVGSSSSSTTYNAKIGLMYISDYGFAASPANWNTSLYDYDNSTNTSNNWMHLVSSDWTISRRSDTTNLAFGADVTGNVFDDYVGSIVGVRPAFYLNENVEFSGGTGTQTDPYRI